MENVVLQLRVRWFRLPADVPISISVAGLKQPFHPLFFTGARCVTAAAAHTHLHRSSRHDQPRKMLTPRAQSPITPNLTK